MKLNFFLCLEDYWIFFPFRGSAAQLVLQTTLFGQASQLTTVNKLGKSNKPVIFSLNPIYLLATLFSSGGAAGCVGSESIVSLQFNFSNLYER